MTQLDITQAKSNLSKLLDLAIKGEEIIITQNDKPVAKISPFPRPLDTHTFLWFVKDDFQFSDRLKNLIEDANNLSYHLI
ncbi:MAG: type II toxin-antitoxin system prevent-host-death family antitoxin [Xenococcus sp. (in: cyanobacteria)]